MSNYHKELLKTTPSLIKGIAVQTTRLNGNQNASLSFDDINKMASFGLALGSQISEANKYVQLPTPDNGALEAKMAELERLYHLSWWNFV